LHIVELHEPELRQAGFYDRPFHLDGNQRVDDRDGKPFSTDFSFTRFLVPALNLYKDWALFVDADFLFRADVAELFALADDKYAVMCVPHDYRPAETVKMDGQKQELYNRKNWSSLVLFNCEHPANRFLACKSVNFMRGGFLHGFNWLRREQIGPVPEHWNWLEGWSDERFEPRAVHFTRGIPTMAGYENAPYADEWKEYLNGS
tara:strand:- start:98 stop:709 length:612 start_codon:yes stop_codon:yes gene_type:complete